MAHQSYIGQLLIAVPELLDPNFQQSVVLVIQHDSEGASGLVLNQSSRTTVGEVFEDEELPTSDQIVHVGGPVEGPLMALHGCVAQAERDVLEGVYFSMRRENLVDIVSQTFRPLRLFCGYSGWGPNQLDSELSVGGWLVLPGSAELVFADPDTLWQHVGNQFGMDVIFSNRRPQSADPEIN